MLSGNPCPFLVENHGARQTLICLNASENRNEISITPKDGSRDYAYVLLGKYHHFDCSLDCSHNRVEFDFSVNLEHRNEVEFRKN